MISYAKMMAYHAVNAITGLTSGDNWYLPKQSLFKNSFNGKPSDMNGELHCICRWTAINLGSLIDTDFLNQSPYSLYPLDRLMPADAVQEPWPGYTVKFRDDYGPTLTFKVNIGESITVPANPSHDGKTFLYWLSLDNPHILLKYDGLNLLMRDSGAGDTAFSNVASGVYTPTRNIIFDAMYDTSSGGGNNFPWIEWLWQFYGTIDYDQTNSSYTYYDTCSGSRSGTTWTRELYASLFMIPDTIYPSSWSLGTLKAITLEIEGWLGKTPANVDSTTTPDLKGTVLIQNFPGGYSTATYTDDDPNATTDKKLSTYFWSSTIDGSHGYTVDANAFLLSVKAPAANVSQMGENFSLTFRVRIVDEIVTNQLNQYVELQAVKDATKGINLRGSSVSASDLITYVKVIPTS